MDINIIFIVLGILLLIALALFVSSKLGGGNSSKYRSRALDRIQRDTSNQDEVTKDFDETLTLDEKLGDALRGAPFFGSIISRMRKAGVRIGLIPYMIILVVLFVVLFIVFKTMGLGSISSVPAIGIVLPLACAFGATMFISNAYLNGRVEKRNDAFLNQFPDAVDMVVRSVKSGHPLLAALKMIALNAEAPLSTEFQQVIDEVSYGRPLSDSLRRMADRIDLLDISFFVVILAVQQETGGNLAEVLSNLSDIIRKRKQMRLKIRALTSEGRATGWIFAGIPVVQLGAVGLFSPDYLKPLYSTDQGKLCVLVAFVLIVSAIYISRRMCKIDI